MSWSFSFTQKCLISYYGSCFLLGKLLGWAGREVQKKKGTDGLRPVFWHVLQNEKWGLVRQPDLGWREENQRKPSIDAGAGFGSCPWAKINSLWQWNKMLLWAPARGRPPKSQLRWSNEPGDLRGLGARWLLQAAVLCKQFIETGLACLPHPSGLGLRTIRSAGGASRWKTQAVSGREEKLVRELWELQRDAWRGGSRQDNPRAKKGELRGVLDGWTFYSGISILFRSPGSLETSLSSKSQGYVQGGHLTEQEWIWVGLNLEWLRWRIDRKGLC